MICENYTIRFVLHRRKDTPRQHLQMRVTPRGCSPVSFATGVSLTDMEWDPLLGRAKGRTAEAAAANTLIAEWSRVVADLFRHYESLAVVPTTDNLRKDFARLLGSGYSPKSAPSITVVAAFLKYIDYGTRELSWSDGTVMSIQTSYRRLRKFCDDTPLDCVDVAWLEHYHQWLVDKMGLKAPTVDCALTIFRGFMRWCKSKDLYHGDAHEQYRPRIKGARDCNRSLVFLTVDELRAVENFQLEGWQAVTRDVFLFGCYTGLRMSDILTLRRSDCTNGRISVVVKKTGKAVSIPINDKAQRLLDKYEHCKPNRKQKKIGIENPALPSANTGTMDRELRKVMKLIGIDATAHKVYYIGSRRYDETCPKYDLITTHAARHTFIVTAISLGIPIPVIMEWTGHSSYNAMRPYIAVANDTSVNAMQRFNCL